MFPSVYAMNLNPNLVQHFLGRQKLFRDGASSESAGSAADDFLTDHLLAQARARCGDYVATLATELDKIAQSLALAHAPEAPALERLVQELLYIDKTYDVTMHPKARR